MSKYKPVVLVILDGWGIGKSDRGNAIAHATLPTIAKMDSYYPRIALQASGISVGLPWGEPGNSEVGHITLGAGKIIYQNMPRITMDIQTGAFYTNEVLLEAIEHARANNSSLHLMGLVGKGGVHSYIDHLYALLELAKNQNLEKVFIHVFTDGRDSSPTSGVESIKELQKRLGVLGIGKIASICGRYYAMDRNNNWDRTEKAYNLLTQGSGEKITDPTDYLEVSYKKEIFDEYIEPAVITQNGEPIGKISEHDSLIFFNFREDRARQITKAFALPEFMKFKRTMLSDLDFITMVQYEEGLPVKVAYEPIANRETLGLVLSQHNKSQLRISETEKFAHVTYFFDGGAEDAYPKEDRVIIPSLSVESFTTAPQMCAVEITDRVITEIGKDYYDFILINYANADIVGHTSDEPATIKAVETIDACLARLISEVLSRNGCLLITADHGNAEELQNIMTGERDTEHSVNPVPLWFITATNHSDQPRQIDLQMQLEASGLLSDIAPTVLELLEIEKPKDMTGESLLDILK